MSRRRKVQPDPFDSPLMRHRARLRDGDRSLIHQTTSAFARNLFATCQARSAFAQRSFAIQHRATAFRI